jgi:phosphoenolpyruvate carboxykinase (ATP)
MKLALTRKIIAAIHDGTLTKAPTTPDPVFGISVVTACPGVPPEVLIPRQSWADKDRFDGTARKLAGLFVENFNKYQAADAVRAAGPKVS